MDPLQAVVAFGAGLLLACATVPVGISGAVLLLPVHLWLLDVPAARVAATNLLYNVISVPGTLVRWRQQFGAVSLGRSGPSGRPVTGRRRPSLPRSTELLLTAAALGAVLGTLVRWHADTSVLFPRIVISLALILVGVVLVLPRPSSASPCLGLPRLVLSLPLAGATGLAGGLSGIGGGSLLAPALVALGTAVRVAAPLALTCTWVTSLSALVLGLALPGTADSATLPVPSVGIAAGLGGLAGGWIAVRHLSELPEVPVRRLLALLAVAMGSAQLALLT